MTLLLLSRFSCVRPCATLEPSNLGVSGGDTVPPCLSVPLLVQQGSWLSDDSWIPLFLYKQHGHWDGQMLSSARFRLSAYLSLCFPTCEIGIGSNLLVFLSFLSGTGNIIGAPLILVTPFIWHQITYGRTHGCRRPTVWAASESAGYLNVHSRETGTSR